MQLRLFFLILYKNSSQKYYQMSTTSNLVEKQDVSDEIVKKTCFLCTKGVQPGPLCKECRAKVVTQSDMQEEHRKFIGHLKRIDNVLAGLQSQLNDTRIILDGVISTQSSMRSQIGPYNANYYDH